MNANETEIFHSIEDQELKACLLHVADKFGEEISLASLAAAAGISEWAVCRRFQTKLGKSPLRWIWLFRTNIAAECMKLAPDWPLTDISVLCGFASLAHFSRQFKAHFNETPTRFRDRIFSNSEGLQKNDRQFLFDDLLTNHQYILARAANTAIGFQ